MPSIVIVRTIMAVDPIQISRVVLEMRPAPKIFFIANPLLDLKGS
jgi:hypothetical protein